MTARLAETLDSMAECDGQTPDEYIQERVILYLQDWLYHINDPGQGTIRAICGHYGGPNLVAPSAPRNSSPDCSRQSRGVRCVWQIRPKNTVPNGIPTASRSVRARPDA